MLVQIQLVLCSAVSLADLHGRGPAVCTRLHCIVRVNYGHVRALTEYALVVVHVHVHVMHLTLICMSCLLNQYS